MIKFRAMRLSVVKLAGHLRCARGIRTLDAAIAILATVAICSLIIKIILDARKISSVRH